MKGAGAVTSGIGRPSEAESLSNQLWRTAMQVMKPILAVPLPAKIAGANLLVVMIAAAVCYAVRGPEADRQVLLVAGTALAIALAMNVLLITLALKPLRELERAVWRVWAGKLESRVPASTLADAELQRVSNTVNYLLEELDQDRSRARSLAAAVVRAGDRERARVGHELHDSIAQSVAAIRFQLLALEQEVAEPLVAEKLRALRAGAGELLEEIRLLSLSTHPRILVDLGLIPALRHLAKAVSAEPTVTLDVAPDAETAMRTISADLAGVLYSIAQEAIQNAIRHGSASRVSITLGLADGTVLMHIVDDGIGFDLQAVEARQHTAGLFAMRERTALADGALEIVTAAGQGTSVRVQVPLALDSTPAASMGTTM
jgi:signal transduction histidine kinase